MTAAPPDSRLQAILDDPTLYSLSSEKQPFRPSTPLRPEFDWVMLHAVYASQVSADFKTLSHLSGIEALALAGYLSRFHRTQATISPVPSYTLADLEPHLPQVQHWNLVPRLLLLARVRLAAAQSGSLADYVKSNQPALTNRPFFNLIQDHYPASDLKDTFGRPIVQMLSF